MPRPRFQPPQPPSQEEALQVLEWLAAREAGVGGGEGAVSAAALEADARTRYMPPAPPARPERTPGLRTALGVLRFLAGRDEGAPKADAAPRRDLRRGLRPEVGEDFSLERPGFMPPAPPQVDEERVRQIIETLQGVAPPPGVPAEGATAPAKTGAQEGPQEARESPQGILERLRALGEQAATEKRLGALHQGLSDAAAIGARGRLPGARAVFTPVPDFGTAEIERQSLLDEHNLSQMVGAEDPQSPTSQRMRQFFASAGINVPESTSAAILQQALPELFRMAQVRAAAQASEPLRDVSEKALLEVSKMKSGEQRLQDLINDLPRFESSVGPIEGRLGSFLDKVGVGGEGSEFRRRIQDVLNMYIKEMTGAQLSREEAKRLLAAMGSSAWNHERLERSFRRLLELARRDRQNRIETLRRGGFDVSSFESAPEEKRVPMRDPQGEVLLVHPKHVKRARAAGWTDVGED